LCSIIADGLHNRGDRVNITLGRYKGSTGIIENAVFQRTIDYPEAYAPGYHVLLGDGKVVTVLWDQIGLT
jgi:hypothetical protein